MKLTFLKSALALVLAGVCLTSTGRAATTTYSPADIILAFRAPADGVTSSVLINVGQITQFTTSGPAFTVASLGADLTSTFGNSWTNGSANLFWGASGITNNLPDDGNLTNGDLNRTLYATKPTTPTGAVQSAWLRNLEGTQNTAASRILTYSNAFNAKTVNTVAPNGLIQGNSVTNSYNGQIGAGNSFNYFGAPKIEGNFGAGADGTALDFFRMQPGSGSGDYLGRFTINSSGTVTFTPVPEPTAMVTLFASLGLISLRRRRK